jgi:hypothetical protein
MSILGTRRDGTHLRCPRRKVRPVGTETGVREREPALVRLPQRHGQQRLLPQCHENVTSRAARTQARLSLASGRSVGQARALAPPSGNGAAASLLLTVEKQLSGSTPSRLSPRTMSRSPARLRADARLRPSDSHGDERPRAIASAQAARDGYRAAASDDVLRRARGGGSYRSPGSLRAPRSTSRYPD